MIARKSGRIVTLGSVAGLNGRADGVMYATAKAAVHEYTRCLAAQLRPYNVTVNCVAPGGTMTARFVATGQANPEGWTGSAPSRATVSRRTSRRAVEYFVTDAGRHVSGQVLARRRGRSDLARVSRGSQREVVALLGRLLPQSGVRGRVSVRRNPTLAYSRAGGGEGIDGPEEDRAMAGRSRERQGVVEQTTAETETSRVRVKQEPA
jgi:hypothetical protein